MQSSASALLAVLVAVLLAARSTAFNQRGQMPQRLSKVAGIGGMDGTAPPSTRPALIKPRDHWTKRPLPTRKAQQAENPNPFENSRLLAVKTDWTTYASFQPKGKKRKSAVSAAPAGTIAIKDVSAAAAEAPAAAAKPSLQDLFNKFSNR